MSRSGSSGNNTGYSGLGMGMGLGSGNCCCNFPTLVILILIVLQFSRRRRGSSDGEGGGRNQIIDNSILFIIALFYLSCCNPCKSGFGGLMGGLGY